MKNVTYMGNAFPHNYADAGDDERGMMVLEYGVVNLNILIGQICPKIQTY